MFKNEIFFIWVILKKKKLEFYTQQEAPINMPALKSEECSAQWDNKAESKISIKASLIIEIKSIIKPPNQKGQRAKY